jgi:hypothetical protein
VVETGLIAVGLLVLFFLVPHRLGQDDLVRYGDIEALLQHGKLTTTDGYSLVMPLTAVPVLMLGHLVKTQEWWAARYNVTVVALGALAAYRLLRGHCDPRLFRLSVLVILGASFFTNRLRDWSVETFTATLVTLGIICLATNRHVAAGWAAIVIGVVNTPAAILALALLAGWHAVRTRQIRHLAAVPAAAALIMLEAWVRRGGPFVTGYGHQGFGFPFVPGLVSILFSSGRGLLFFMPGLVLWVSARRRRLLPGRDAIAMMLVFTAGLVLVYASWWAWDGGISWGPRFFLFAAVPASILVAAGIWKAGQSPKGDAVTLAVLAMSAWVAFAGVIPNQGTVDTLCIQDNYAYAPSCDYNPVDSGLWAAVKQIHQYSATTSASLVTLYLCLVFVYLAAPLVASVARSMLPRRSWAAGWRL